METVGSSETFINTPSIIRRMNAADQYLPQISHEIYHRRFFLDFESDVFAWSNIRTAISM